MGMHKKTRPILLLLFITTKHNHGYILPRNWLLITWSVCRKVKKSQRWQIHHAILETNGYTYVHACVDLVRLHDALKRPGKIDGWPNMKVFSEDWIAIWRLPKIRLPRCNTRGYSLLGFQKGQTRPVWFEMLFQLHASNAEGSYVIAWYTSERNLPFDMWFTTTWSDF